MPTLPLFPASCAHTASPEAATAARLGDDEAVDVAVTLLTAITSDTPG